MHIDAQVEGQQTIFPIIEFELPILKGLLIQ